MSRTHNPEGEDFNMAEERSKTDKMPDFEKEHLDVIKEMLIENATYDEMTTVLMEQFPIFAEDAREDEVRRKIRRRLRYYATDPRSSIYEAVQEGRKQRSDTTEDIPIASKRTRLKAAQRLYEEWQPETLVRVIETKNGNEYPIYMDNSRALLNILEYVDKLQGGEVTQGEDGIPKDPSVAAAEAEGNPAGEGEGEESWDPIVETEAVNENPSEALLKRPRIKV